MTQQEQHQKALKKAFAEFAKIIFTESTVEHIVCVAQANRPDDPGKSIFTTFNRQDTVSFLLETLGWINEDKAELEKSFVLDGEEEGAQ